MATATIVLTGVVYLAALPHGAPVALKGEVMRSANDRVSTHGGAIPRHVAFLKVLKADLATPPSRDPDMDLIINGNANAEAYVFLLHGEKIAINGFTNNAIDFVTNPAGPDEGAFLSTVARVQDFCPTCRLQSDNDFDSPDLNHVGANFEITKGRVFARQMSKCMSSGVVVPWKFDAEFGYPGFEQARLPREVAIQYDVTGNLTLQTTALQGATGANPFNLKFKNRKLDVVIGSATIEDITGVEPPHSFDRTDHHFELFYYLLERSNAAKHPLPVADTACPDFHRSGGVDCPPVQQ